MMQKIMDIPVWGGTRADGGQDDKQNHAALTRNVHTSSDGTYLSARFGTVTQSSWALRNRAICTIWTLQMANYPGKVFVIQASGTNTTSAQPLYAIGVYEPAVIDATITTGGKSDPAV